NPDASPRTDPIIEAAEQIDALIELSNTATAADPDNQPSGHLTLTPQAVQEAIHRITSRLTEHQRDLLTRLRIEAIIHRRMTQPDLAQDEALALTPNEAATLPGLNGSLSNDFIVHRIAEYLVTHSTTFSAPPPLDLAPANSPRRAPNQTPTPTSPNLQPSTCNRQPSPGNLQPPGTPDSRLPTPDSRLQPPDSPPRILPGLERYILPTHYIGDWPPTTSPTTDHPPLTPDHRPADPRPPTPALNSQVLPMSCPHPSSGFPGDEPEPPEPDSESFSPDL